MAFGAFALLVEEVQTVLLLLRQGGLIAGKVAVVGGITRDDGALEGRQGLRNAIEGDRPVSEGGGEKRAGAHE